MSIRVLFATIAAAVCPCFTLHTICHHQSVCHGTPAHARAANRRRQQHMLLMACAGIQIEQPFAVLPLANFSAIIEQNVREELQASNVSLYCVTFKDICVPCIAQAC